MKKIGIITMVKNESDVIELFLKINLRSVDKIFVIDHRSEDGTFEIAKEMQKIYPQIELFFNVNKEFNQSQVITEAVRRIASQNIFDYLIPLDADEFICETYPIDFREILSSSVGDKEAVLIPWETYCPTSLDYFNSDSPLYNCFKKRSSEPNQFYKVILGNEFAKECVVSEGNHTAFSEKYQQPNKVFLNIKLKHVPVRSSEQLVRKALMGSYALALKVGRKSDEGYHWDEIASIVRSNGYKLGLEQLSNIALHYAAPKDAVVEIDHNTVGIGSKEDKILFSKLAKPSLIRDYDLLVLGLLDRLKQK
jgi:hypothetical protein